MKGLQAFEHGSWLDSDKLRENLIVSKEESLFSLSKSDALNCFKYRNRVYMGFLNMVMSVNEPFKGYAKGALYLNFFFLVILEILVYLYLFEMTNSRVIPVLCVIMIGFSAIVMGLTLYIRFYVFALTLLLAVVYCHLRMWKTQKYWLFLLLELLSFIFAFYGLWQSELILVICGTFFCLYFLALLVTKRFINAVLYAVPLIIGLNKYVHQQTDLLLMVMHPSQFMMPNSGGKSMVAYNLMTVTKERAANCFGLIKDDVYSLFFGHKILAIAFFAMIILVVVVNVNNKIKGKIPAGRQKGNWRKSHGIFAIVVFLTAVTGLIFNLLTDLYHYRYICFFLILFIISFWYFIAVMVDLIPDKNIIQSNISVKMLIVLSFTVITIISAISCQQPEKYPFLYIEDKEIVQTISKYGVIQ